jgi:hypothetical protein
VHELSRLRDCDGQWHGREYGQSEDRADNRQSVQCALAAARHKIKGKQKRENDKSGRIVVRRTDNDEEHERGEAARSPDESLRQTGCCEFIHPAAARWRALKPKS